MPVQHQQVLNITSQLENISSPTPATAAGSTAAYWCAEYGTWSLPTVRPWRFSLLCDLELWPFDLWVNACRATAIEYMCTKFGVNSSSRFTVRAWTNRLTDGWTERLPMPVAVPAWVTTTSDGHYQLPTILRT